MRALKASAKKELLKELGLGMFLRDNTFAIKPYFLKWAFVEYI